MAGIKRANTSGITKSGTAIPDVPDAPTIGVATANGVSASVTFTAAATGGTPTSYTVTSSPDGLTGTGASAPITVSGLTDGTAYTFTVTATNSSGTSAASSASNSITAVLAMEGAYDVLGSATLATSADYILFSGIPYGYTHLQLKMIMRSTRTEASDSLHLVFNGDASSYPRHYLYGNGSTAAVYAESSSAGNIGGYITEVATAANASSGIFGHSIVDILDASNPNKYKTVRSLGGYDANGSGSVSFNSHLWMNTAPVTSIKIQSGGAGDWVAGSTISLYGVR